MQKVPDQPTVVHVGHPMHASPRGLLQYMVRDLAEAAGCLVITNSQSVSDEVFDGELPVYRDPMHLKELVDHFLNTTNEREALTSRLRQQVLREHTYAHRAKQLGFHLKRLRPEWFAPTPGFQPR